MAVLDFLFEGKPPAATTTYGSSTSTMPAWYNDYTQGLISKANAIAATPYQAYTGARVAATPQAQTDAWAQVGNLQRDFNSNFNPAIQTMQGMQGANAPRALNQYGAMGMFDRASDPNLNPLEAAKDNLGLSADFTQAGGMTPASAGISNYMNPYTNNVVADIGRLGRENLDNTMSGIADKYISGGQFGGSRMGRSMGNAMRAGARDIAGLQGQALERGYTQALGASQGDLGRQLQAGSQFGQLGSTMGGLAGQTQQNLANLGQSLGTFGAGDLQRQMDAAKGQGALAQTGNEQAIRNAAALESAGTTQQGQQQRLLDTAYQDFVANRDHPQQMASFMNNMIRGLQIPVSQQTTQTGPASTYQASPLAQIAAAGTGVAGLSKLFGGT